MLVHFEFKHEMAEIKQWIRFKMPLFKLNVKVRALPLGVVAKLKLQLTGVTAQKVQ